MRRLIGLAVVVVFLVTCPAGAAERLRINQRKAARAVLDREGAACRGDR
jgi:hypothetical protein